jgi:23S rRNA (uracil1939-C5)-methyltransferase
LLPEDATHIVLRLDRSGGLHLIVRTTSGRVWSGAVPLARALNKRGCAATVWWHPAGGAPRVLSGDAEAFPATVFEQINPAMGDRVRAFAVQQLGAVSGRRIWDLYSGIGETTELLLDRGGWVESVEVDRRAVDLGERRAQARWSLPPGSQRPGDRSVIRHVGRAEDVVRAMSRPDLVITNPPRTGMDARVVEAIASARPERVVYVSCDPATLARDLARLMEAAPSRPAAGPAFRVAGVRSFDLFPQTAHVETVLLLEAT